MAWRGNVGCRENATANVGQQTVYHRGGNNVARLAASGIRPVTNGASGASLNAMDRATTSLTPADRSWEARARFRPHTVAVPMRQPGQPKTLSTALSVERQMALRLRHSVSPGDNTLMDVECAVCCMEMKLVDEEALVRLPCGGDHVFHWRCLLPWLDKASFCPTCRGSIRIRKSGSSPRGSPTRSPTPSSAVLISSRSSCTISPRTSSPSQATSPRPALPRSASVSRAGTTERVGTAARAESRAQSDGSARDRSASPRRIPRRLAARSASSSPRPRSVVGAMPSSACQRSSPKLAAMHDLGLSPTPSTGASFGSGAPAASFGSPSPRFVALRDPPAPNAMRAASLSGQAQPRYSAMRARSRAQRDYDIERYIQPEARRAAPTGSSNSATVVVPFSSYVPE